MTSDEFFASGRLDECFEEASIDLAFFDGDHCFEHVLRDIRNIELHCVAKSVVVIHNVIPPTLGSANREPRPAPRTMGG